MRWWLRPGDALIWVHGHVSRDEVVWGGGCAVGTGWFGADGCAMGTWWFGVVTVPRRCSGSGWLPYCGDILVWGGEMSCSGSPALGTK